MKRAGVVPESCCVLSALFALGSVRKPSEPFVKLRSDSALVLVSVSVLPLVLRGSGSGARLGCDLMHAGSSLEREARSRAAESAGTSSDLIKTRLSDFELKSRHTQTFSDASGFRFKDLKCISERTAAWVMN